MKYIPTMGLEIHAELKTNSKIFCSCAVEFGGEPNSRCCPVCTGMPGALPVLNKTAVEYIIKAGYTMNCDIQNFTKWDRKNYFYPDLPKAYQNSQMPRPVCMGGYVDVEVNGEQKRFRINHIHLEEDAGKLVHDDFEGVSKADYNRGCIPLIEIVTEPDFHSSEEVIAFFEKVRMLLMYAGVCDGRLEQGSMRCDVNLSIAPEGSGKLGTRTETKNLNSLRTIVRAIDYEIDRQTEILENGGSVIQQTMRFNDATGETSPLRSKEDAHDYRYFPDPDIPPVVLTDEEIKRIVDSVPELPEKRLLRYVEQYELSENDAKIIVNDLLISSFYDECVNEYDSPKTIANFIVSELLRRINLGEISMDSLPFSSKEFALLVKLSDTDKISKNNAKAIFRIMAENGGNPEKIADENNMWIKEDSELLNKTVFEVLENNPKAVQQYKNGDTKVLGFLIGQCNRVLKGAASPKAVQEALRKALD